MNQVTRLPKRAVADSALHGAAHGATGIEAQARDLDASLFAFARQVLSHDDAASDLPLRQLRICIALVDGPRSMSSLSRELNVSLSAMTQIADRLERAGMVERHTEGGDRRVRSLALTARARKMLRTRDEERIRRVVTVLEQMPAETRGEVLSAMAALRDICLAAEARDFE